MPSPNATKVDFFSANIDLTSGGDTVRVALYNDTTAFTFDPDTHAHVSDILDGGTTAEEFGGSGGTGYARKTLANQAVTQDDADDEGVFDADDLSWSALDVETIQGVIIYQQVGGDDTTPGDDAVLAVLDDSGTGDLPLVTNGSGVDLSFAAEGILNLA